MRCPKCKSVNVYVVDSRPRDETTWRRRECATCKNRFNTMEMDEETYEAFMKLRNVFLGVDDEEEYY